MAIAFHYRDPEIRRKAPQRRIALFPGAWNPPTVAHAAIARAALEWAGEVIWILPRAFPHKSFEGARFEERLSLLQTLAQSEPGFSVAVADRGLYVEIADEARAVFGHDREIALLCGRDAAERIAAWDYGKPGVFEEMLERYPLLVAARAGDFVPSAHHADRIVRVGLANDFDEVSSTEVRERIRRGDPWRELVPAAIREPVAAIYR